MLHGQTQAAEIATRLWISYDTARTHLAKLYAATGALNKPNLITWAYATGMATPAATRPDWLYIPSERELDVICLIAEGRSRADAAWELRLDPSTVKSHLKRLAAPERTGQDDRVRLTTWAWHYGFLRREEG